nr:hypothetical protein BaRGS_027074 [Batillaria attramentaria]
MHEGSETGLRDGCPLLMQETDQFNDIYRKGVVVSHTSTKGVPKVLNGSWVRRASWKIHPVDPLHLHKFTGHTGMVRRGVVFLENGAGTAGLAG